MGQDIVTKPSTRHWTAPKTNNYWSKIETHFCQTLQVLLVISHSISLFGKPILADCSFIEGTIQLFHKKLLSWPKSLFGFAISPEWTFWTSWYFYKTGGGFLTTILTRELQTGLPVSTCQSITPQYPSISQQTQAWLAFVYGNKLCLEILKKPDFLPSRLKNINCHRDISSGTIAI